MTELTTTGACLVDEAKEAAFVHNEELAVVAILILSSSGFVRVGACCGETAAVATAGTKTVALASGPSAR